MVTENTAAAASSTGATTSSVLKKSDFLGKEDFMKLFVEQLKNQDPMNPMENYEVASQLAQYSSLEQLVNINENFKNFTELTSKNLYFQGVNLIGKDITYEGNEIKYDPASSSNIKIDFKLNEGCEEANVNIYDKDGNYLRTLSLKNVDAGDNSVQWDGKTADGSTVPAGIYNYKIAAYNGNGTQITYTPYGKGTVNNVSFNSETSETILKVNNSSVQISDVVGIGL